MDAKTVKLTVLRELIDAGSLHSAAIVGLAGGYSVQVRYGTQERALATRTGEVRVFAKIDAAAKTLRALGVVKAELDTSGHQEATMASKRRPDRTQALKDAHQAAEHDQWFRAQVTQALAEADGTPTWHDHDSMFDALEALAVAEQAALATP